MSAAASAAGVAFTAVAWITYIGVMLGFYRDRGSKGCSIGVIMENHMEKNMENEMDTGGI